MILYMLVNTLLLQILKNASIFALKPKFHFVVLDGQFRDCFCLLSKTISRVIVTYYASHCCFSLISFFVHYFCFRTTLSFFLYFLKILFCNYIDSLSTWITSQYTLIIIPRGFWTETVRQLSASWSQLLVTIRTLLIISIVSENCWHWILRASGLCSVLFQ